MNEDRAIQLKDEFELEKGEDAPMSMAAHAEVCEDLNLRKSRRCLLCEAFSAK